MYRKTYSNKNRHIIKIYKEKQEKLSKVEEVEHRPNTSISLIL